ncbi:ORF85 [Leucania separata nucleopolyhedrovirus]|uniref:ORF85 n=1 Tax=Leucania separata nucleopolyhedrovirus TaxID=1307956 RepID=Q0IL34_NPVLS|nr:ORF85 [Leucania separata nucleopolyhedrovirus]AAR28849.1 ORF85 [Leucania separata nucleopolyhedrovirus]
MNYTIFNKKNCSSNMRHVFNQYEPVVGSLSNFYNSLKRSYLEYVEVLEFDDDEDTTRNNAMLQLRYDDNMTTNGLPSVSYARQMEERSLIVKRRIVDRCVQRRDIAGLYRNCLFFNLLAQRTAVSTDDRFIIEHHLFMRKLTNDLMKTIIDKNNVFDDWFVIYAWALVIYIDYLLNTSVRLRVTYETLHDEQGVEGDELALRMLKRAHEIYEDWSSQYQLLDMRDRLGELMRESGKYRFGCAPCTCIMHKYNEVLPVYVALVRLNMVEYALNTFDGLATRHVLVDRWHLKLSNIYDRLHCHIDIRIYTAQGKYKNCDPALCDSIEHTVWSGEVPIEMKTHASIRHAVEQVCDRRKRDDGGFLKRWCLDRMCVIV